MKDKIISKGASEVVKWKFFSWKMKRNCRMEVEKFYSKVFFFIGRKWAKIFGKNIIFYWIEFLSM